MKKNKFTLVLMAVILISGKCLAQSQEDMKKYEEYMAVGPMQQMMAKSVGVWSANITMWTNPGADPMSSTEEVTYAMIMGGRYLQYTSKGQMYGMPFEGVSTTGYDNSKKIFVSSWIDNMGTGMIFMQGNWDQATKTISLSGATTDPLTGKDMPIRETVQMTDDNHQTITMYFTVSGKEFKALEIKCTRK